MTLVARAMVRSALLFGVALAGCSDDGGGGFSSNPTNITGASQSGTTSTGDTTAPTSPTGTADDTTTGPPTTGESASSTPPCAELTLCPEVTSDPTGMTSQGPGASDPTGMTGDPDSGDPDDPCSGAGDGNYCGSALGGLADHNSVYQCAGGVTTSASPCPAGCEDAACKQVAQDPCASAQSGNGDYCGGTLMGGDGDALYTCQAGATASKKTCNGGCKVNPPGIADACNPEGDPCAGAGSGDGPYCGGGLPTGDVNVLYHCVGKATQSSETCAEGCQQNRPGVPDACKKAQNGGECCLDVPPGAITQNFSACGGGGSHYGIDYGTAIGTPIYAGMAGTVVGSATGFPNCYNNGCSMACWNAFNYVKLKSDCGDPDNAANDLFIYYLHVDSLGPGIANGAHVDQGQLLALSGNSGCSSGPHIHIETASVPKGQGGVLNTCASVNPSSRYCP